MDSDSDANGTDNLGPVQDVVDPFISLLDNHFPVATAGVDDFESWISELHDRINRSPSPSTHPPTPTPIPVPNLDPDPNPDVFDVILKFLQEKPSADAIVGPSPIPAAPLTLNSNLVNHPCRVPSALSRSLGSLAWGRIIAEMSHLIVQHVKHQGMGTTIPDGVFKEIREAAMKRLGRSPFRLESVTSNQLSGFQENVEVSWGSLTFCKLVCQHLIDAIRTARESSCETAQYFILADSDSKHPGIVRPNMTDDEKRQLLSKMVFSSDHGCELLHQYVDGKVTWFGNREFAHMVKLALYDIACPGWCGVLKETQHPDTGVVTVCQATEVSSYAVALQITWLVHVARFYLETQLQKPTTFRPPKRRAAGGSQTSPWLEWSNALNNAVISDMKMVFAFLGDVVTPQAVGSQMEEGFEKLQSYLEFISRPTDIPYLGSLGSFLYADPLPIDDQSISPGPA